MVSQLAIVVERLSTKLACRWFRGSVGSSMDFDNLGVAKLVMAKATKMRIVLMLCSCVISHFYLGPSFWIAFVTSDHQPCMLLSCVTFKPLLLSGFMITMIT